MKTIRATISVIAVVLTTTSVPASDWPTLRADSARSGYTEDTLPSNLTLRWSWCPQHAPKPAWPRDVRMTFDWADHVAVSQGLICFASSADGKVTALNAETGPRRENPVDQQQFRRHQHASTAWRGKCQKRRLGWLQLQRSKPFVDGPGRKSVI